jgi:hypothetical protein
MAEPEPGAKLEGAGTWRYRVPRDRTGAMGTGCAGQEPPVGSAGPAADDVPDRPCPVSDAVRVKGVGGARFPAWPVMAYPLAGIHPAMPW